MKRKDPNSLVSRTAAALYLRRARLTHCFSRRIPQMGFQIDARFNNRDAFGLQQFFLQGSVGLANKNFAALTNDAMPGNAFSRRGSSHGAASAARSAGKAQSLSQSPIR